MEIGNLLNALVQGSETATLAQVEPRAAAQPGANTFAEAGPGLPVTAELRALAQPALTGAVLPGSGIPGPPGLSVPSPPDPSIGGQPLSFAAQQPSPGQPGINTSPPPGAAITASRATSLVPVQPGNVLGSRATLGASADIYYGSGAPASASLLSHSGIGAYIHLLNALAGNETDVKSARVLTDNLGNASATLKADYYAAVSALPAQLQQKDWGFSISNGVLVFTQGKDALSAQDLAELQKAFSAMDVENSAREVAAAITSIEAQRQSGVDPGALAWGGLEADDTNFNTVVNLRAYVTSTVPGGNYSPATSGPTATDPAAHPEIPAMLGGMDLRELVSARPEFFRANGSVITDEPEEDIAAEPNEELGSLHGQCSCGQVQFFVENAFEYAFYCHCSRCRLRTGSAFAAIAGIGIDKVQVTAGSDHLLTEGECADGYGARCSRCYAFLFAATRERRYMHISLGVLSGTPNRLPDHHVYVGSKAPWFQITDALPQYEELPGN